MGRCGAPCTGAQSVADYGLVVARAVQVLVGDSREVVGALQERMGALAAQQRFEEAGSLRDRALALVRGIARAQRIAPLATSPQLVAARRGPFGGWDLACVRYGRLAGASVSPPGADPMPYVAALVASAEVVQPPLPPCPAASAEETEKILRWLESPGVRIVDLDGVWTCPVGGAGAARALLEPLAESARRAAPFDIAG
jgi:DNA polymerase-3 subunit epsilon